VELDARSKYSVYIDQFQAEACWKELMSQNLAGFLNLRHITGLTGTDLELNSPSAKGFAAGQPMWMYD
jgi:hypothetical protein